MSLAKPVLRGVYLVGAASPSAATFWVFPPDPSGTRGCASGRASLLLVCARGTNRLSPIQGSFWTTKVFDEIEPLSFGTTTVSKVTGVWPGFRVAIGAMSWRLSFGTTIVLDLVVPFLWTSNSSPIVSRILMSSEATDTALPLNADAGVSSCSGPGSAANQFENGGGGAGVKAGVVKGGVPL